MQSISFIILFFYKKCNTPGLNFSIKQTVLRDQSRNKTGVSSTRSENLVNVVKHILDRIRLYNNIRELESKKSAEQRRNQQGQGIQILAPNQMLSRLPISLAQLNARNNSEKLKNEIRQLLFSL